MADTPKKRSGERDPIQLRRIGYRHALITPPRETTLVDMNRTRVELEQVERVVNTLERQLAAAVARRDRIKQLIAAFDLQSIDRVDGDPTVPLDAPVPDPAPEDVVAAANH
jgi:hypothetical protein